MHHFIWARTIQTHHLSSASRRLLLIAALLTLALTSGCGGGLSPEEVERYDRAEVELAQLRRDQSALERRTQRDFNESAKLERARQISGAVSASCSQQLSGQRLGPLPFRKRKGRSAYLNPGSGRVPSGCAPHKLSVR